MVIVLLAIIFLLLAVVLVVVPLSRRKPADEVDEVDGGVARSPAGLRQSLSPSARSHNNDAEDTYAEIGPGQLQNYKQSELEFFVWSQPSVLHTCTPSFPQPLRVTFCCTLAQ